MSHKVSYSLFNVRWNLSRMIFLKASFKLKLQLFFR